MNSSLLISLGFILQNLLGGEKMSLFRVLLLTMFVYSLGMAIPPPDNSSPDKVDIKDNIKVSMYDVDDLGFVVIWNGDGAQTVAQAEWHSGQNGSCSKYITKYLTKGTNYIVFILYNKIYDGGIFFPGGKWSYTFQLSKNGNLVWSNSNSKRDNTPGIKYWKVIQAYVSSDGTVSLTDNIPSDVLRELRKSLVEMERKIASSTNVARPF
jgi:hypothetical protein